MMFSEDLNIKSILETFLKFVKIDLMFKLWVLGFFNRAGSL